MRKTTPPQPFQTDTYICKGGNETWEQRFSYSGFRFAEVTGFPGKPSLDNFEERAASTDFEGNGEFSCSSELLNKIQRGILLTRIEATRRSLFQPTAPSERRTAGPAMPNLLARPG